MRDLVVTGYLANKFHDFTRRLCVNEPHAHIVRFGARHVPTPNHFKSFVAHAWHKSKSWGGFASLSSFGSCFTTWASFFSTNFSHLSQRVTVTSLMAFPF